ncbi:MAG: ABC transporter permease [Filimonas sp.]|nr:ABC transporter permease [Filimonas sp.]
MIKLLKIEWLKVKNYRTFWILSALFLISIYGINYITYEVQSTSRPKANPMADAIIGTPPFQFPDVWHTVSYMSSFLLFIPGLLMIISMTNEYSFKTHRQNVIDGLSRTQFIMVKMVNVAIIAFISTLAVFLTALGFGLAEGASYFSFEKIEYIGYFFIQALSYTGVALLFSVLFKRSGIAIGVFFLYVVVLENLLAGLLNRYVYGIGHYLPLESTDNLIPFPFFRNVVKQFVTPPPTLYLLIAAVIYLAAYFFVCRRKFETDDL